MRLTNLGEKTSFLHSYCALMGECEAYLLCGESKSWGGGRHKNIIFLNMSGRHFVEKKIRNAIVGSADTRAVAEENQ